MYTFHASIQWMVTPSFKPSIRCRRKEAWLSFCLTDTTEPAETYPDPNGRLCFTFTHPCAQVDCLCVRLIAGDVTHRERTCVMWRFRAYVVYRVIPAGETTHRKLSLTPLDIQWIPSSSPQENRAAISPETRADRGIECHIWLTGWRLFAEVDARTWATSSVWRAFWQLANQLWHSNSSSYLSDLYLMRVRTEATVTSPPGQTEWG